VPTLGVNIDHVATIRQARHAPEPDPVWAAVLAELGGADCITCHLREDRRHINDRDVELLRKTVRVKLNLEMSLTDEIVEFALRNLPGQVTLVPERRTELTTEGGLDVVSSIARAKEATRRLRDAGIVVSMFIDPDARQVAASAEACADAVEFHTGRYAEASSEDERLARLDELRSAIAGARAAGLVTHAGHGLTYLNVKPVASLAEIEELNIGHTIVSRAVLVGMERAVREMKALLS
jgi:pyridoxine 5-phosphate synthase